MADGALVVTPAGVGAGGALTVDAHLSEWAFRITPALGTVHALAIGGALLEGRAVGVAPAPECVEDAHSPDADLIAVTLPVQPAVPALAVSAHLPERTL